MELVVLPFVYIVAVSVGNAPSVVGALAVRLYSRGVGVGNVFQ